MAYHIPNYIIFLNILNFIFLTPFSVIFGPFLTFCVSWSQEPIWEYNSFHYGYYLLLTSLCLTLEKFEHFNCVIVLNIFDFMFLDPLQCDVEPLFRPFVRLLE